MLELEVEAVFLRAFAGSVDDIIDVDAGHGAVVEGADALGGGDIGGAVVVVDADAPLGMRRREFFVAVAACAEYSLVESLHLREKGDHLEVGVGTLQGAGVRGASFGRDLHGERAFVGVDDAEAGGFADNATARAGLGKELGMGRDLLCADAEDLFVGCDDDVDWGFEIGGLETGGRANRSGKGAFHVAGTAAVELVVGLVGVVGIAVPTVGGIGGYDVVVAHQG